LLASVVGGLVSSGCGDGALRTLSEADVTGIPPGNASGALFSGRYALTRAWKEACRCRSGSCAEVTIDPDAGILTLVQDDGMFTSSTDTQPGVTCDGAINSDGSFICGQVAGSPPVSYSLTTGEIALANGQPTTMKGSSETTTFLPGFECDLQIGFDGSFIGR
jgi:hypothetical protein